MGEGGGDVQALNARDEVLGLQRCQSATGQRGLLGQTSTRQHAALPPHVPNFNALPQHSLFTLLAIVQKNNPVVTHTIHPHLHASLVLCPVPAPQLVHEVLQEVFYDGEPPLLASLHDEENWPLLWQGRLRLGAGLRRDLDQAADDQGTSDFRPAGCEAEPEPSKASQTTERGHRLPAVTFEKPSVSFRSRQCLSCDANPESRAIAGARF